MTRARFVSAAALIAAAVVGITVTDYIGAVFALTIFGIFLLSLLLLPLSRKRLTLTLEQPSDVRRGEDGTLSVHFSRSSFFPSGDVKLTFRLINRYTGLFTRESVIFRPNEGTSVLTLPVRSPHTGMTEITVERVWFYDLTGLFALPRTLRANTVFCVLPQTELFPVQAALPEEDEDSDDFDPNRSGHSRPELFGLHEYAQGDSIRSIHWKLSARLDKIMVREFVRPVSRNMGILLLNGGNNLSTAAADKLMDAVFSLSLSMAEANLKHTLCWCENGQAKSALIQSEEDVFLTMRTVLSAGLCADDMLCSFLHGKLPPASLRLIFAASGADPVIRSLLPKENDRLLFIGTEAPALLCERVARYAVCPADTAEHPAAALSALLEQEVRA